MYPRSPVFSEWVKDEAAARWFYDAARRGAVSGIWSGRIAGWALRLRLWPILSDFGAGRWRRLRGSRSGLFLAGHCFRFQGADGIKLAEQARRGVECVPGFLLATEDHDLAEVKIHCGAVSNGGLPERLAVGNRCVESMP